MQSEMLIDETEQKSQKVSTFNPLDQFVQQIETLKANCPALLELIKQILEAPGVHVFGELLHIPSIAELEKGPDAKYFRTLNLFAHGTYKDYVENREQLLELTPVMKKKLQHLTIVTLAIKNKCILYSQLLQELDIKNVRDLEDIIIEAIYADIIHGKLDQKNSQLEVDNAIGRDIRPQDVKQIVATLQEWCESCETVLSVIDEQICVANSEKQKRIKHKEKIDQEILGLKKAIKSQSFDCDETMEMREGGSGGAAGASNTGQEQRKKPNKVKASRTTGVTGPKLQR